MEEFRKSLSDILGYTDERFHAVAVKSYFNIMKKFQVNTTDVYMLIGSPEPEVFDAWQRGEGRFLTVDEMRVVSFLLGIYRALHTIFKNKERANGWVHKRNDEFGGKSALEVMLAGRIAEVRNYLEAQTL